MYPIVRVMKRIPDGSVWQRYRAYRLADLRGTARVYLPPGTRWWNPLGGWVTQWPSVALFPRGRPFVISCIGLGDDKRFYIDIVRASTVSEGSIEYLDLYLDVMIDAARSVTEKDEEQVGLLDAAEQVAVYRARDDVRARIATNDPWFDPDSDFFDLPPAAAQLEPLGTD